MKKNTLKGMSFSSLRAKLMSTVAMLLVASTLLVTSSYAWFVMSTAPEVTGIDTQVGANGALEIALLNADSWDHLDMLDKGDIDESATEAQSKVAANLTWGNLVNLQDPSYGLSQITLMPSRLYIQEGVTDGEQIHYNVNAALLKTPIYGEDGRVTGLDSDSTVNYVLNKDAKTGFGTRGYGVRAVGTAANMSVFQLGMNSARIQLSTATSAASAAASKALEDNGNGIANIVLKKVMGTASFAGTEVQPLLDMAVGLQGALEHLESALRTVFAGYVTTKASGTTTEGYQAALDEINNTNNKLSVLFEKYGGIGGNTGMIPEMGSYITQLETDQATVKTAISTCGGLVNQPTCTWTDIYNAMKPLVNYDDIMLGDQTIKQLEDKINKKVEDENISKKEAAVQVLGPYITDLTLKVPTGSGIISDIADFAGDYTVKVNVTLAKDFPVAGGTTVPVTMQTVGVTPPYLTVCSNAMAKAELAKADGASAITDFYGYAIDLAFRTNAAKSGQATSGLLLQTDPQNRVYEGSEENKALQGGGSYMEFATTAGLSATKMVKLMDGIRVVFMDGDQKVLALAKLDMTLDQSQYTKITDGADAGKYYLHGFGTAYQVSDLISETDYNSLAAEGKSSVVFTEDTRTIKAKLYLYDFQRTPSTVTKDGYTGGITVAENKRTSAVITELTPDVVQKVTALVYLDGSKVTNATVAANAQQSMSGTLNLQFSSDAALQPARNTALEQGTRTGTGTGESGS